ncbi:CDP-glycerol glycerophosphotransferase family protein [Alkalibacter mobilis]|uniref:CDP-glycerol glycerophosphotransferase family protein n=1 Tax=Alkalibacter mobilis TaxID=2787712 RepID=UPI00189E29C7|nr:CDP-glycerol glycerophosphotransferase family protein [Alkalibacter mobilis]MBF7096145.1 CDP-glycerol glycerophosphotransferase family protein [Alkalibacter mobilis]
MSYDHILNDGIFADDISWERINLILRIQADLDDRERFDKIQIVSKDGKRSFELPLTKDDKNLVAKINVMSINKAFPLAEGMYRFVLKDPKGKSLPVKGKITVAEGAQKDFIYGKSCYSVNPMIGSDNDLVVEIIDHVNFKVKPKSDLKNFIKATRKYLYALLYKVCTYTTKVKENRVLFATDSRISLGGNLKFVHDRLVQKYPGYEIKYLFKEKVSKKRGLSDKFKMPCLLATSKYIIIDDYYPMIYGLKLRKGVELVQLWHAVGAFKTFGYSRVGKPGGPTPFSTHHKNYTKAIVSSREVAKYYAEGFGIEESKVHATGVPRTDVFFDEDYLRDKKREIYQAFPIFKNKKVITFAPTFRGAGAKSAYYDYDKIDFKEFYEMCKDEYVVIFKMHPFVTKGLKIPEEYKDKFFDLSGERDINDLLLVTDLLITDYSSTCFEYSLLGGPMLFYAYDLDEYISGRDFYYKYEDFVPGKICRTFEELLTSIRDEDYMQKKVEPFRDKFFEYADGGATERVVDLLFSNEGDIK